MHHFVLTGIGAVPELSGTLVFKVGRGLKKFNSEGYRLDDKLGAVTTL